ncbi:atp-dependent rna helicase-like protein [Cystoisospora suis]|uniref:RNA helicase n=1 Tax=Cystoisospora suis TaxID=483139 RepID=A0A2C6KSN5_9APIC|nr:atp-dependent rna helicase-like protein [Cystoisospora suis]
MPSSLIQRYLVCEESSKPLYLILLLHYLVFYQRRSRWSACDPRESSLQEESSASHLSRATPEDSHGMPKKKTKKKERNGASDQGQEGTDDEEEESEKEGEEEEKKKSDDYGKSPSSSSLPPEKIRAIIFCRSRDETHRLARLLQLHFGRGSDGVHEQVSPELEESSPHRGVGLAFSSLFYPPSSSSLRRHTSGDKVEEEEERAAASVDKNEMRRSASTGRDREDSLDVSPPGASRETFNDNDANTQEKEEEKKKIERRKFSEKVVLNVREICSTLSQKQRLKTINQFRRGLIEVIVCSDVAARGLDVDGVKLVCHYDAPQHIQSYIHRSGRSAR